MIPGYNTGNNDAAIICANVNIYVKNQAGTTTVCGVLADYYYNSGEIRCNLQGNEVIVEQQVQNNDLFFCGFAVFEEIPVAPSVPAAPSTSVVSGASVTFTWVEPFNGFSPITGYTVAI